MFIPVLLVVSYISTSEYSTLRMYKKAQFKTVLLKLIDNNSRYYNVTTSLIAFGKLSNGCPNTPTKSFLALSKEPSFIGFWKTCISNKNYIITHHCLNNITMLFKSFNFTTRLRRNK